MAAYRREIEAAADPDEKRRALAGDDQPPRFVRMDHAKSETAFEFLQCSSNSIHEVQP